MSVISRSIRRTSCFNSAISRALAASSLTSSRVSTAERTEVSGFLISWETSAAKRSMVSMRFDKVSVMDSSERARSASSSLRSPQDRGSEMARA